MWEEAAKRLREEMDKDLLASFKEMANRRQEMIDKLNQPNFQ